VEREESVFERAEDCSIQLNTPAIVGAREFCIYFERQKTKNYCIHVGGRFKHVLSKDMNFSKSLHLHPTTCGVGPFPMPVLPHQEELPRYEAHIHEASLHRVCSSRHICGTSTTHHEGQDTPHVTMQLYHEENDAMWSDVVWYKRRRIAFMKFIFSATIHPESRRNLAPKKVQAFVRVTQYNITQWHQHQIQNRSRPCNLRARSLPLQGRIEVRICSDSIQAHAQVYFLRRI
jgi:hypothetical protein